MAMDALHTSDSPMNGGNVPLLFSADCITRLHRTLASLEKGGGENLKNFCRRDSSAVQTVIRYQAANGCRSHSSNPSVIVM